MSDEIEPALSAEEWAEGKYHRERRASYGRYVSPEETCLLISNDQFETNSEHRDPADFHALAALALYGQSFGFTQTDVELLNDYASDVKNYNYFETPIEMAIRSLAARIEALLPPSDS